MVKGYWPEIDAENGRIHDVLVSTTEKVPRAMRLIARGTVGHGRGIQCRYKPIARQVKTRKKAA